MLIKKELEQITVKKCLDLPTEEKSSVYVAAVQVLKLAKCGKMLVIDVFEEVSSDLKMRFFSDGVNYLLCKEWPARAWLKQIPSELLMYQYQLSPTYIHASKKDIELAHKILKPGQRPWDYHCGIKDEMDSFVRGINTKKQEKAMERKYSKMEAHFAMFPDYPADLAEFCETDVFKYTYIFLSKIKKGKKEAICGHCGHKFTVIKKDKPEGEGICPGCKMPGKYRDQWRNGTYKEKAKICIVHKVENQLLIRWTNVTRTFADQEKKYDFYDYYRNLYLNTPKGPLIYAYDYKPVMLWGENWYRQKNGSVNYGKSFVYTNNLKEVFGDSYYHVDLEAGLKNAGVLSFASLLDNLKNIPASEYLFKMGMPALAAHLEVKGTRAGFSEVLGINKQYLSLYRKYNVIPLEHRIIKASKTWVSEYRFEKLRLMGPEYTDVEDIVVLLKSMSFERFINYFSKQKALAGKKKLTYCLTLYKDYMSMSKSLKVDMTRKSIRFPENIKKAHDLILPRFNQVKHKNEDKKFKQAVKKLYSEMKEYAKGDYCIIFPALRSDLITEGQSLNHCVGSDTYYKNHIAGTKMIFFIRQSNDPGKQYFTMEIDMKELKILQLYGFNGCSAPPEVKKFANEFLKRLKPLHEKNEIRITVPA